MGIFKDFMKPDNQLIIRNKLTQILMIRSIGWQNLGKMIGCGASTIYQFINNDKLLKFRSLRCVNMFINHIEKMNHNDLTDDQLVAIFKAMRAKNRKPKTLIPNVISPE